MSDFTNWLVQESERADEWADRAASRHNTDEYIRAVTKADTLRLVIATLLTQE